MFDILVSIDRWWSYAPPLWEGLKITLQVSVCAMALGMTIGLFVATMSRSANPAIKLFIHLYVQVGRIIPELIQVFIWYYVLPDFGVVLTPFMAGVVAIGVAFGPFVAEVVRAGIESVPKSQWEVVKVFGYSRVRTWRRVILPQAVRNVFPVLTGYVISIFKATSLLSFISLREVFAVARNEAALNFRYFELFAIVMVIYLALTVPLTIGLKKFSNRYFIW
jgi:polar amino acid transport system permease protein